MQQEKKKTLERIELIKEEIKAWDKEIERLEMILHNGEVRCIPLLFY